MAAAPRRRTAAANAVLAALAVDAGRLVTTDALIDRVWGDRPPQGARAALHAHIARIRRLLDEAGGAGDARCGWSAAPAGTCWRSSPTGWTCTGSGACVERARDPGRADAAAGGAAARGAGAVARRAAGRPAGTVGRRGPGEAWRQQHVDAVVAWARAELQVGDPAAVIGPVTELRRRAPAGGAARRGADARAARGRPAGRGPRLLRRDRASGWSTSWAPSRAPSCSAIHQAILRGDARRAAAGRRRHAPAPPTPAAPAQLPRGRAGFAGRERGAGPPGRGAWPRRADQPTAVVICARVRHRRAWARPRSPCTGRTGSPAGSPTGSCT